MLVPNAILLAEVAGLLAEGKEVELKAKGCSMLPFIVGDRDSVRLRKEPVSEGDAVLAEIAPGHYVLHRIVSMKDGSVTLKGDGNLVGTEHCHTEDIKGKAVAVISPNGRIRDLAGHKSKARAARWNALPYIVRRYTLAIIRRLI